MAYLLGVDTGGTFTDFVLLHNGKIRIHKILSTPDAPERAILQGITALGLDEACQRSELLLVHGSTVATNAALEGKGARTAFISNRGFKDMLTLGRQTRRELYNLQPAPIEAPVPESLCLETGGRLGARGELLDPISAEDLAALKTELQRLQPEAVAINLLFSFLDDSHEAAIEQLVRETLPDAFCSRSSTVLPEYKEYERGMATWLNAWLGPRVAGYLHSLQRQLPNTPIAVMQSSGGTISANQAAQKAVNMLLSGPAGGLAAARYNGDLIDSRQLLTFDMGGTSTDVALIDGDIALTNEGRIGHYPVAVPMVDMHTIGAGGGSLAAIDAGGILQLGPESAGADPGPACYGRGGTIATVTDANVVLGRLPADALLGGTMALDKRAAQAAVGILAAAMSMSIEETALGILQIANEHMVRALRTISVQRGADPADYRLCCFGGAGGLHVCELAEQLHMTKALIPIHGGVLSALGMLVAPRERQMSRSLPGLLSDHSNNTIEQILDQLKASGQQQLLEEGIDPQHIQQQSSLDLRYNGQSFSLAIPWTTTEQAGAGFHAAHEQRYGHQMAVEIELVTVRVALKAYPEAIALQAPKTAADSLNAPASHTTIYGIARPVPIYRRAALNVGQTIKGPALIIESVATTLIGEGWSADVDQHGNLLLDKHP